MDWFFKIVRIAGVNFPGAASLVQLQAEIDSGKMAKLMESIRDPISYLHEDVQDVSKKIYKQLKTEDSIALCFSDEFYSTYSRAIAALDSQGLITKESAAGSKLPLSIQLTDASYIMYMCRLAEDSKKMNKIIAIVDECEVGCWLDGDLLGKELDLPKNVVKSIFSIYESKGYGILSRAIGSCKYMGQA
jgi:hypothetical protein